MSSPLNVWDVHQQKYVPLPCLKGKDGYTPQKGVDYFTADDIASLGIPSNLKNGSADGSIRTEKSAKENASYEIGYAAFTEGMNTKASGDRSHAEGNSTEASANESHAEGNSTLASGHASHSEGSSTIASGNSSHAEGNGSTASGGSSHSEGDNTSAQGWCSHTEGKNTIASESATHAEGLYTEAKGLASHSEGMGTKAYSTSQHAQGKYNVIDSNGAYLHIVGNGTSDSDRSNAHTIAKSGNAWFSGDVYIGSTSGKNRDEGSKKLATEEYADNAAKNKIDDVQIGDASIVNNGIANIPLFGNMNIDVNTYSEAGEIEVEPNTIYLLSGANSDDRCVFTRTNKWSETDVVTFSYRVVLMITGQLVQEEVEGKMRDVLYDYKVGFSKGTILPDNAFYGSKYVVEWYNLKLTYPAGATVTVIKNKPII